MTKRTQDTVLGIALLLLAVVWSWLAVTTIPDSSTGVGPRAFPLAFGLILAALSAILLIRTLMHADAPEELEDSAGEGATDGRRWMVVALVVAEVVAYGLVLKYIGFVLATPVIVIAVMFVNMRERSLRKLVLTPAAITLGCWVIFEKLLGIYLANGIWLNIG